MTILLRDEELGAHLTPATVLAAMEEAFRLELAGRTRRVPRTDLPSGSGFLRVMPGVYDDVMGLKVMTLASGLGTRYVVLLCDVSSGELLAIIDADEMTRARTAATTAMAARHLCEPAKRLAIIGSGFEAVGHLRALAHLWALDGVVMFSPDRDRRTRFADWMTEELGITVDAAGSAREALEGQKVVVLATKSEVPVLDGTHLAPGAVVLSIGSTRLDLRELDLATFRRASVVVGDDPEQLARESGDVADAIADGAITESQLVALSAVVGGAPLPAGDSRRDLVVFKSVGTAIQDLAIARAAYHAAVAGDFGVDLGDVATLKPFAASVFAGMAP